MKVCCFFFLIKTEEVLEHSDPKAYKKAMHGYLPKVSSILTANQVLTSSVTIPVITKKNPTTFKLLKCRRATRSTKI